MRECQKCHWYQPNDSKIRCINLSRKDWQPIEESNTCDDFILPCDYKPDRAWSMILKEVDKAIKSK